jgi:hypothetical protein
VQHLTSELKADRNLVERALFAFGLLEALEKAKLPFIFKGGSCLLLLLKEPQRLSTDIDMIVEPNVNLDFYLKKWLKFFLSNKWKKIFEKGKQYSETSFSFLL